ncbi:unnamed protein product [Vicia faba]|uniref:Uncharacterized protein n=1 Tax=Vicia faba TaxID=3906 RepID=A0AAV0ZB64_VICFA|nr:unnamed protein product [Vicia faba]
MHREEENKVSAMDSLLFPSFSVYSSNNLNDVAQQVIIENDFSHFQNDNDNFEFVVFQKTADEAFFDHRQRNTTQRVFSISKRDDAAVNLIPLRELVKRDGYRRNSDGADNSIPSQKLITGDHKWNIDHPSSSSSEVEDDLDEVPPASYCLWTPKSPKVSPIASPINCEKSNSTGSTSNPSSSKRWKFLSLLRRSKSDGKEPLIIVTPSLEFKKEAKVESSKVKSGRKGSAEKNVTKASEKKIQVMGKKIPAPVTAMESFYLRKKEIKQKSYLPYKQELIGFGVGFHTNIGRGFPLHV